MSTAQDLRYPKRLIEVDLPIARISAHARREKSIRHGHISTLHIWWARRPLAACRAVILASLWPDPAPAEDEVPCPPAFMIAARKWMVEWAERCARKASAESSPRIAAIRNDAKVLDDPLEVRRALLDFIADYANWDHSTDKDYLEISRALTQAAHEALGGKPGTRPLVVDPFAGGGSIPLEALRVGADAYASDLNPVPVLLNKVALEYMPKYGPRLAEEMEKWGRWIREQAQQELSAFYPIDPDGAVPVTYLWARTIRCEGPECGIELPLFRSLWLAKKKKGKGKKSIALRPIIHRAPARIEFEIVQGTNADSVGKGTSKGGAATCPICGYTTAVESVRSQLCSRRGGARDARLLAVLTNSTRGRLYRLPIPQDLEAFNAAVSELQRSADNPGSLKEMSLVPDGEINHLRGFFNIVLYGITQWGDLFSPRQALTLTTLCRLVRDLDPQRIAPDDSAFATAVKTSLALVINRVAVRCTANCIWDATTECIMQVFNQGQSLPARWEFAEMCPLLDEGSGWNTSIEYMLKVIEHMATVSHGATVQLAPNARTPRSG